MKFSPDHPCRCGFDGEGVHRCHAGRENGPEFRCPEPGIARWISTGFPALAGMQLKVGLTMGCYCEAHWLEAGFDSPKEGEKP